MAEPLRTRRDKGSAGGDVDIDHVIVFRGEIVGAAVLEDGDISDPRPVTATAPPDRRAPARDLGGAVVERPRIS